MPIFPSYKLPMVKPETDRSHEEVHALIAAIQKDVDTIPERNIFGESNKPEKKECRGIIRELKNFLVTGEVPRWSESYLWLVRSKSEILTTAYGELND